MEDYGEAMIATKISSFKPVPRRRIEPMLQLKVICFSFTESSSSIISHIGFQSEALFASVVVEKPAPVKISPLLTSRHLSQRCLRLPVAFFNDDEETPSTPKADALFVPRENPRALVIRPLEPWHSRSGMTKTMANGTPVHENAI
ncbi:hypothetical protein OROHE_008087 [Orobanche hederae]